MASSLNNQAPAFAVIALILFAAANPLCHAIFGPQGLGGLLGAIGNSVTPVVPTIVNGVTPAVSSIVTPAVSGIVTPAVSGIVTPAVSGILNGVTPAVPAVVNGVTPAVPAVVNGVTPAVPAVVSGVTPAVPAVVSGVTPAVPAVVSGVTPAVPAVVSGVTPAVPAVVSGVTPAVPAVVSGVSPAVPAVVSGVSPAVPAVVNGVSPAVPAVVNGLAAFGRVCCTANGNCPAGATGLAAGIPITLNCTNLVGGTVTVGTGSVGANGGFNVSANSVQSLLGRALNSNLLSPCTVSTQLPLNQAVCNALSNVTGTLVGALSAVQSIVSTAIGPIAMVAVPSFSVNATARG